MIWLIWFIDSMEIEEWINEWRKEEKKKEEWMLSFLFLSLY